MININQHIPLVSVLMSVYSESEEWICEAIDSIISQDFRDFEFIIINDNPDRSELRSILNSYEKQDSRIRIVENAGNIGLTKSLNVGLDLCVGKYIARMDADDISMSTRLQKQVDFMEKYSNIGVCGSWARLFGDKKGVLKLPSSHEELKYNMLLKSAFVHPSVLMRKSILLNHGIRYNHEYTCSQDSKLWADLSFLTTFSNIPEPLIKYRISAHQISNKNQQQKNYAYRIRRDMIRGLFGFEIESLIYDSDVLDLEKIKNIARKIKPINIHNFALMESLYLSLDSYSAKVVLSYILNLRYFKFLTMLKLIKRIFNHEATNKRLNAVKIDNFV